MANTWYLGPVGALVAIPAPASGIDASPGLVGKVSVSLNGTQTLYRASQPRTWNCQWNGLTEDQTTYLRLIGHGLVTGPIRLIDGEIRNRLPMRVASGGSYSMTPDDFRSSNALTPTWVAVSDPPATVPVRGAVSFTRTTTGLSWLIPQTVDDRVPLISGEQVRASCWVRGTAIQAAVALDQFDTYSGSFTVRTTGAAATLDPVTWTYLEVVTTPGAGRISASPLVTIASGQPVSTVQATGWQLAAASSPTTWSIGGGAPTVLAGAPSAVTTAGNTATTTGLSDTYIHPGVRKFGLTLIERQM